MFTAVLFLLPTIAQADVITIEGTITSVDATKRTITIESDGEAQTLDVSRKAKVSFGGKAAALDSLSSGQKVILSYHDDLEIVLKVDVIGGNSTAPPEDAVNFGGHAYKFYPDVLSWRQARTRCEQMGGCLAVINSQAENTFIFELTTMELARINRRGKLDGIWLGATDEEVEGKWVWIDGKRMSAPMWNPGQPNNAGGDEHYLWMWIKKDGLWTDQADSPKEVTSFFVCEWENVDQAEEWLIGDWEIEWTEQNGNTGTFVYTFSEENEVFRDGSLLGRWERRGEANQVRVRVQYASSKRGHVVVTKRGKDQLVGKHNWRSGRKSTWKGRRLRL